MMMFAMMLNWKLPLQGGLMIGKAAAGLVSSSVARRTRMWWGLNGKTVGPPSG